LEIKKKKGEKAEKNQGGSQEEKDLVEGKGKLSQQPEEYSKFIYVAAKAGDGGNLGERGIR